MSNRVKYKDRVKRITLQASDISRFEYEMWLETVRTYPDKSTESFGVKVYISSKGLYGLVKDIKETWYACNLCLCDTCKPRNHAYLASVCFRK